MWPSGVLETTRPVAFDLRNELEMTGRVVIVDDFGIAGAGVILEALGESESVIAGASSASASSPGSAASFPVKSA